MKKRTIIYIASALAITLIIAFAIFFIIKANKTEDIKFIITKYNDDFEIEKIVEIKDKKQINEIKKICENPSLEQDDKTPYLAIRNDIKLDLTNGKFFMIQEDFEKYCYFEDSNSNTKLVIKMPDGLLEKINNILQ